MNIYNAIVYAALIGLFFLLTHFLDLDIIHSFEWVTHYIVPWILLILLIQLVKGKKEE